MIGKGDEDEDEEFLGRISNKQVPTTSGEGKGMDIEWLH